METRAPPREATYSPGESISISILGIISEAPTHTPPDTDRCTDTVSET